MGLPLVRPHDRANEYQRGEEKKGVLYLYDEKIKKNSKKKLKQINIEKLKIK